MRNAGLLVHELQELAVVTGSITAFVADNENQIVACADQGEGLSSLQDREFLGKVGLFRDHVDAEQFSIVWHNRDWPNLHMRSLSREHMVVVLFTDRGQVGVIHTETERRLSRIRAFLPSDDDDQQR